MQKTDLFIGLKWMAKLNWYLLQIYNIFRTREKQYLNDSPINVCKFLEANEALVSTNSSHKSFEKEFKYTCYNDIQDKSKMPNKKHSGGNKNCFKMRRRVFRLSMIFGIVLYCQLPCKYHCIFNVNIFCIVWTLSGDTLFEEKNAKKYK